MNDSPGPRQPEPGQGLCPECRNVRIITSDRGSVFLFCRLSAVDPRFPKYPPQPVIACPGFSPR